MHQPKPSLFSSKLYPILIITLLTIGMTLFLIVLNNVYTTSGIARLDIPVLTWVTSHRTPLMTSTMATITNILSPTILAGTILLGALVWAWRKKEIWRPLLLVGAMGASLMTSTIIKNSIERGRPPTGAMIPPLEFDFSFPSGHTLGVAVCLLVLTYLICSNKPSISKTLGWICIAIIGTVLIAFSRLYLGYHWLTDVSASSALALIILAVVILVDRLKPAVMADKKLFTKVA